MNGGVARETDSDGNAPDPSAEGHTKAGGFAVTGSPAATGVRLSVVASLSQIGR
jgi:hypothetical protein